ncbi:MAG TPA: type II CAAX endopeptidase family protein [Candidatus Angelobacter sp.]
MAYGIENMGTFTDIAPCNEVQPVPQTRSVSLVEIAFGTFIVLGHNVFHIVPNEVPILFVIGWLSIHFRNGGWAALGLKHPVSWKWTVAFAMGAAAIRILLGELVTEPISTHFFHRAAVSSVLKNPAGDVKGALLTLVLVWTFAAFGEEMVYRGYLLTRAAETLGRSRVAYWAAMLFVSVLFGYGHFYKGPAGVLDSGVAGLILGAAYLLSHRNLWVPILAHGLIDTFAVVVVFFGLQS